MTADTTTLNIARESLELPGGCGEDSSRIEARNALALQFRPYVYRVARDLVAGVRTNLEVDDLIGWGCLGLLEAADRYDPTRGVRFRSYAHARIRGAMLDAIRLHHGRHSRIAEALGVTEFRRIMTISADASYDGAPDASDPEASTTEYADAVDLVTAAPDSELFVNESRQLVESALDALSPLERSVIIQHYVHGEPVCVIARRHKVSKSWLSRVHARALAKLRRRVRVLETRVRSTRRRAPD
jgi:RNA polymerase sigma factor FliA